MKPIQDNRSPRPYHARLIALILGLTLMLFMLLPAAAISGQAEDPTVPAQTDSLPTPLPTPIPQEWKDNREQTTAIIGGAIILATIIIGGTLHTLAQNKEQKKKPDLTLPS
ncbi:MAG TPA: hypothetical protein VLH85_04210 [Levilinea sp.]|nr:hypothetical protein [Levilinea sp.]